MPIICTLLEWAGLPYSLFDYVTIIFIFFKNANLFLTFFAFLTISIERKRQNKYKKQK